MSKSTPSLLALLGLVAVAGYQNRGKISDMLANAQQGGASGAGGPGAGGPGILGELSKMFGGSATTGEAAVLPAAHAGGGLTTGLNDLMDRFRSAGKSTTADSWVSTDANHDLHPDDLEHVIGGETIDELVQKTGLARSDILSRLAAALPETVNRLTPQGRLPSEEEARSLI